MVERIVLLIYQVIPLHTLQKTSKPCYGKFDKVSHMKNKVRIFVIVIHLVLKNYVVRNVICIKSKEL